MTESRSVPHLRKGIYYTLTNCANRLALSMPKTNKYTKDKLEFQQLNPNNINQIWMFEEISNNKYEIVHAISTLVLEAIQGSNNCKLQFGKQKSTQLYFIEEGFQLDKFKGTGKVAQRSQGIRMELPITQNMKQKMDQQVMERSASKSRLRGDRSSYKPSVFKAGERFVARIRIKENEKSRKYLYSQQATKIINVPFSEEQKDKKPQVKAYILKYMQIDIVTASENSLWQLRQVFPEENQMLSQTCYIASYRSGDVLDVPEASQKQGVQIIQYPCNFRFNQKWILKKVDEVNGYSFYMIMNAKNGLYLDIKGQLAKEGTPIIQWQNHEGKNQIWRLEQQGKRTYLIRSALDKDLVMGVKQNSLKQCAEIVTSRVQTQCFWVIHGYIPE